MSCILIHAVVGGGGGQILPYRYGETSCRLIYKKGERNMKKVFTIVLALGLVLAMGVVCFASGDYSTLTTQLNEGLGADAFIGALSAILPWIMTITIVALVWYLIKKGIKKFAKGKPGV